MSTQKAYKDVAELWNLADVELRRSLVWLSGYHTSSGHVNTTGERLVHLSWADLPDMAVMVIEGKNPGLSGVIGEQYPAHGGKI